MTLTGTRTHSWCSRWLAITRTPSVNGHRLWCHYTHSSQRRSAISPFMTMIHSVWSDNSIYAPANDGEWKSERVIVGATAPVPTRSGHSARTQIIPEHRHCPYRLLRCPSVLCPLPALACHIYSPPSPGMLLLPASSFLFIMTGKPQVPLENFDRGSVSDYFVCLHLVKGHAFIFSISPSLSVSPSPRLASPHLSLNRDWPTPKPTRLASSVPTCPATSSRTAWSISCLSSPPVSACSPSVASRAPTTSMPAALTATGQQRTSFFPSWIAMAEPKVLTFSFREDAGICVFIHLEPKKRPSLTNHLSISQDFHTIGPLTRILKLVDFFYGSLWVFLQQDGVCVCVCSERVLR